MGIHIPIIRRLATSPRRVQITDDARDYKGIELLVAAMRIAKILAKENATQNVGLLLPTSGATAFAALGTWWTGRTIVPLNYLLQPEELQYVVDDCETDTIIASRMLTDHTGFVPKAKRVVFLEDVDFKGFPSLRWPRSKRPDDVAVLLYTSGTSGKPKGVMLTHGNVLGNVRQCIDGVGFGPDMTILGVLPQFHSFGFTVLTMLPLVSGAKVVYSARFVPPKILSLMREHQPTTFIAIPSMYNALLHAKKADPEDFASLEYIVSGGEPLCDTIYNGFKERFGISICEGYGLTETAPVTHWCLPQHDRRGTVGQPLPRVEHRIVDPETGNVLPANTDGEVQLKGPNVMKGYFKLPEQTAAVLDDEGWFKTGDMGRISEDNFLSITGRIKEMLIVGGENVFPREIEEALNTHDAVKDSAVVGLPDTMRGEVPIAYVELVEDASVESSELRSWCRERIAGYKVPKQVRFVDTLPRNPTGKIQRRALKERLLAETAGD